MASKCWFVLRQTHYPPPKLPKNGIGKTEGPISLGHLVPDLKHLDNVINRHGPLVVPPDMPIYETWAQDLTWDSGNVRESDFSGKVSVPIAAAAGAVIRGEAGFAFKKTVQSHWEFERLETIIFQPTDEYVEESVKMDEVTAYLKNCSPLHTSSMFMVTGIIVAKGTKARASQGHRANVGGGGGV